MMNAEMTDKIPLQDLGSKRGEQTSEITDAGALAYSVEARSIDGRVYQNGYKEITDKWSHVQFDKVEHGKGVPCTNGGWAEKIVQFHGYLSYEAAQALRWSMLAHFGDKCISTRLVKHYIQFAHRTFRVEHFDEQAGGERVSDGRGGEAGSSEQSEENGTPDRSAATAGSGTPNTSHR